MHPLLQTKQLMQSWGSVEARAGCAAVGRKNVGPPFPVGQCVGCYHNALGLGIASGATGQGQDI